MEYLITLIIAASAAIFVFRVLRARRLREGHRPVYLEFRDNLLSSAPEELGFRKFTDNHKVWGVLMETGYPEGRAMLVAAIDGTASIYYEAGGGITGGGQHEAVRRAAKDMVRMADQFVGQARPAQDFPMPGAGFTRFYILTKSGVFTAQAEEEALDGKAHAFSPLFYAGREVISRLRMLPQRPR